MGILSRLEHRATYRSEGTLANPGSWLSAGGTETIAGIAVDEDVAMTFPPFWAGVVAIAESISSLPLKLYRRLPRGREEAIDRYEYHLVHQSPNDEMVAMSWRQAMIIHALVWGNHYGKVTFDGAGRIASIVPILPELVSVERTKDTAARLFYRVNTVGGSPVVLWPEEVIHIPGPSLNGILGVRPVGLAKEAIGAALASTYFGAAFFGNGSWFGGFLEHPAKLSDKAMSRLRETIAASHTGVKKAMKLKILEEGMKYHEVGVDPENAQLVETNQEHVAAAARINRIPPHRIGDLRRATFSNIEHQGIDYVVHTLRPWLVRIEQELNRKLLSKSQQKELYFQHRVEGLLRGDQKARYESHAIGRQFGWLSANDVREMEDMNSIGEQGDQYMVPLNMVAADQLLLEPKPKPETAPPEVEEPESEEVQAAKAKPTRNLERLSARYQRAFLPIFYRDLQRILTKESNALGLEWKRAQGSDFLRAAFEFFEKHRAFVAQQIEPAVRGLLEMMVPDLTTEDLAARTEIAAAECARAIGERHVAASRRRLEAIVIGETGDVRAELDGWLTSRAGQESEEEAAATCRAAIDLALGRQKERA